jgi:hypothetical protein
MSVKVCPHCADENDETRVFCSNCGTRLPAEVTESRGGQKGANSVDAGLAAPVLPTVGPRRKFKPARVSKVQSDGIVGRLIRQVFLTVALGALLACLVQMSRSPDRIPGAEAPNAAAAQKTFSTMEACATSPDSSNWTVNEAAINQFLVTTIQMVPGYGVANLRAEFRRVFLMLGEGEADYCIEQRLFGKSFYLVLRFRPEGAAGGMSAKITGGTIGRLPFDPHLAPLLLPFFRASLDGLAQATELVGKADKVAISPTDVSIQWPGVHKPGS